MYIVFFDAAALLITLLTVVAYRQQRVRMLPGGGIFSILAAIVLASAFFGMLSSISINEIRRFGPVPGIILTTLYYLANLSILPVVAQYLFTESNFNKQIGAIDILYGVPYFAACILVLTNPLTHLVFFVDASGTYRNGPFLLVLYALVSVYALIITILLARGGPFLTRSRRTVGMLFLCLGIAAIVLQRVFPGLMLEAFSASFGTLFMFLTLQHPKNAADSQTGALSRKIFEQTVSRLIVAKKQFSIVVVYSPDFRGLQELLDFTVYRNLARSFFAWIESKAPPGSPVALLDDGAFGVIVRTNGNDPGAQYLALELLERAYSVWNLEPIQVELTVQVGVLAFPEHFLTLPDALDRISGILKVSDLIGDRHVFYASDIVPGAYSKKARIIALLKNVLESGKLELAIQGIFDVASSETGTAEITTMLTLDSGERIPQKELFAIAGELGLSRKAGSALLEAACRWFMTTEGLGGRLHAIQVSLTEAQCVSVSWHREILSIIERTGIPPKTLYLGIGETAVTEAGEQLKEGMRMLIESGVGFLIDDYGTGYTDQGLLPQLPFSMVKFDEIILHDGIANKRSRAILAGTISYLTRLGFSIAARGIDDEERAELMIWAGCRYLQGNHFGGIEPVERS